MSTRPPDWSIADSGPWRLIWRLGVAAWGVGAVGGAVTAVLAVLFAASDVSLAARLLAFEVPIVLAGMIAQRLAADPAPAGRRLVWTAVGGVVLTAVVQAWPEAGSLADDLRYATVSSGFGEFVARLGGQGLAVSLLGVLAGLAVATTSFLVLAPTLVLLRAAAAPVGIRTTMTVVTTATVAVTTASTWLLTTSMDARLVTGMAAALAGAGAVLTARWLLAPSPA